VWSLEALRRWARLLDSEFVIPGTTIRFGLDPILSLIPGVGDLTSPVFTVALLVHAVYQRVPRIVMIRMVANALIDALIGAIPVAGNITDVFFRANLKNLALLDRHVHSGPRPSRGDFAFVLALAAIVGLLAILPLFLALWLALRLWYWLAAT